MMLTTYSSVRMTGCAGCWESASNDGSKVGAVAVFDIMKGIAEKRPAGNFIIGL